MTYRDMSEETRIQYLRSDIVISPVVYEAATRIFVGYMINKQVNDKNQLEMMEKAVNTALELAIVTDKTISQSSNSDAGLK